MKAQFDAVNNYGGPVTVIVCTACGKTVTVCPPVDPAAWGNECLTPGCPSYDPSRDADLWFEDPSAQRLIRRTPAPLEETQ